MPADVLGTAWLLGTLYLYGRTMLSELRRLSREEAAPRSRRDDA
jgi:hypothetical protein